MIVKHRDKAVKSRREARCDTGPNRFARTDVRAEHGRDTDFPYIRPVAEHKAAIMIQIEVGVDE